MIQKTFGIYGERTETCNLFIEAGETHIASLCSPQENKQLSSFELFQFEAGNKNNFSKIFQEVLLHSALLNQSYNTVKIIWENECCVCVPPSLFNEANAQDYLNTIAGETINNNHASWYKTGEMVIVFREQEDRREVLQKQFPLAAQHHKYGVLLNNINAEPLGLSSAINIIFYHTHFIMVVTKHQQLQLIQRFTYHTANEVIYHILNTCERTQIPVNETSFTISGLIDHQSSLYAELYKYISHLHVETMSEVSFNKQAMAGYPSHYFVPFFKNIL